MTLESISGTFKFKVKGQQADPQWKRDMVRKALANADGPPNALRFQCRIATDARENFEHIPLDNGEYLTLSRSGSPQFGKNSKGKAFLTATVIYSGDGESYRIQWAGDAVPLKMQKIAVRHDKGLAVAPQSVNLDLSQASITPSYVATGMPHKTRRDYVAEEAARGPGARKVKGGASGQPKPRRRCERLTDCDIPA